MEHSYRTFVRSGVSTKPGQVHWTEIEDSMRQFDGADGFLVPQTYLIGVGTK